MITLQPFPAPAEPILWRLVFFGQQTCPLRVLTRRFHCLIKLHLPLRLQFLNNKVTIS